MNFKKLLFLFLIIFQIQVIAQDSSPDQEVIEIFVIDSFITPDEPYRLKITYFTSDSCTSSIKLINGKEILVSVKPTEDHKIDIPIAGIKFDSTIVGYKIYCTDKNGNETISDEYEFTLPHEDLAMLEKSPSLFTVCCFGGVIFGLPSPSYVRIRDKDYLGISKEIPVISFYSKGYNYPAGYISVEYEYVYNAPIKNFLRVGYKQIIQVPVIEYISPGLNLHTDFLGFNGVDPELNIGLFKFYNVFTVFTKYRYSFQPGERNKDMHEFSIGLYSNFFSFNL